MQLEQLHKRALENIGETDAAIFEAHKLFLDNPEFLRSDPRSAHR